MDDQTLGPMQMRLSAHKLSAQGIINMIALYREISHRGEFYQSELQQRMSSMLPKVIMPGAFIKLETFDLATSQGNLQVTAGVQWPKADFVSSENMTELADNASLRAQVRISKKLANEMLVLASQSPYFRDVPDAVVHEINQQEDTVTLAMQEGAFAIAELVDEQELSDNDGTEFVRLLRNDPRGKEYSDKVRMLFMTRDISLRTAYILYWQQMVVKNLVEEIQKSVAQYQDSITRQMQDEFNEWVKKGYVTEKGDDYVALITREKSVVNLNGKSVSSPSLD
jgi:uncharacterized protein YdgA (DUF945 family)